MISFASYTSSSYLSTFGYNAAMRASKFKSSLRDRLLAQCVRQTGHSLFLKKNKTNEAHLDKVKSINR